jgi:hypothetical protein
MILFVIVSAITQPSLSIAAIASAYSASLINLISALYAREVPQRHVRGIPVVGY